jgi:transposase
VARKHDVNANQVFHWRKLYQKGRLDTTANFLPVRVASEQRGEEVNGSGFIPQAGTMEIKLPKGTLRIVGAVDVTALRTVIESLV